MENKVITRYKETVKASPKFWTIVFGLAIWILIVKIINA